MSNKLKFLLNNIMFQYTISSSIITILISFFLITNMTKKSEEHSIKVHSEIYINYIQSIPSNYPQIVNLLKNDVKNIIPESSVVDDHGHDEKNNHTEIENSNSDLNHFITDLLIFPSLTNVTIYSNNGEVVFNYSKDGSLFNIPHSNESLKRVYVGETLHFIHKIDMATVLHTYMPVYTEKEIIGVIEIVDADENFNIYLEENKKSILRNIIYSGIFFYILLFSLFFKANLSQHKALVRLSKSQELTIHAMSLLAELRDEDTGSHIIRTKEYCRVLAIQLKNNRKYSKYLTNDYILDLERSAPLHDIGKVGVSDTILLKPGKLTDDEFNEIKKHPEYGAKVLKQVANKLDYETYFNIGVQVILYHHENWDGSGYPYGLRGEKIPLSARIMAIADVYDALRNTRPYKKKFSHKEAKEIIIRDLGKKFDPELVESFIQIESVFEEISNKPFHHIN